MTLPGSDLPLFCYDGLLRGGAGGGLLAGLVRRRHEMRGDLYRLPNGTRALDPLGTQTIPGECVYAVGLDRLRLLDLYYGVDSGSFRRVTQPLRSADGLAWVYVMEQPRLRGGVRLRAQVWQP